MEKYSTPCCALAFLGGLSNGNTIDEIQYAIQQLKENADSRRSFYTPGGPRLPGGEKSVLVVVSVNEDVLEKNLIKCGFICLVDGTKNENFPRRRGYPNGQLKLYYLNYSN